MRMLQNDTTEFIVKSIVETKELIQKHKDEITACAVYIQDATYELGCRDSDPDDPYTYTRI